MKFLKNDLPLLYQVEILPHTNYIHSCVYIQQRFIECLLCALGHSVGIGDANIFDLYFHEICSSAMNINNELGDKNSIRGGAYCTRRFTLHRINAVPDTPFLLRQRALDASDGTDDTLLLSGNRILIPCLFSQLSSF